MAQTEQSTPRSRRSRDAADRRRDQWVVRLAIGVLAVAAAVVVVGLYVTQYRPPRQHTVTIGERELDASALLRRARYFGLFQGGLAGAGIGDLIDRTIDQLQREAVLRRDAPALVGEVSAEDLLAEFRSRLGFAVTVVPADSPGDEADAGAVPDATAEETIEVEVPADGGDEGAADPEPVEPPPGDGSDEGAADATADETAGGVTDEVVPVAVAEADEAAFGEAFASLLRNAEMPRSEFEDIVRAEMLEQRLRDRFDEELGETAPQVELRRIRLGQGAAAERVREQAAGGADFAALADEHDVTGSAPPGGYAGWIPVETLTAAQAGALDGLEAGEVTAVIPVGIFFDVVQLVSRDEQRTIESAQRGPIVDGRLDRWFDDQPPLPVEFALDDGERAWILDRVIEALLERQGGG